MQQQPPQPQDSDLDTAQIASMLNQALPIKLTMEDVAMNPQFVKLLQLIAQRHLDATGLAKRHAVELERVKQSLLREKQQFFQRKLILDELRTLLHEISSSEQLVMCRRIEHLMQVIETSQVLNISRHPAAASAAQDRVHVLDVSPEFLMETQIDENQDMIQNNQETQEFFRKRVCQELAKRLKQRHAQLQQFWDPVAAAADADMDELMYSSQQISLSLGVGVGASSSLPQMVLQAQEERKKRQKELRDGRDNFEAQYWYFYRQLIKCMQKLGAILEEHKLSHSKDHTKTSIEWSREKLKTMLLKLDTIKYQYLTETYDQETVLALRKLRAMLEQQHSELRAEGTLVEHKLESYSRVGPEFNALVEEYRQILVEIENNYKFLARLNGQT